MDKKYQVFNIIKHYGEPTEGTLPDGRKVHREKSFVVWRYSLEEKQEIPFMIPTAPYDNHFIYRVPSDVLGPSFCCSCGSFAITVGSKDYAHLGSPKGEMFVCHHHTTFGKHADGSK
ncbi:hypothetical protein AYK26_07645 [Euryarchaeota archaeon SM23-78]|nr:MAG: hypothetical protein AYK26_07645 [Euryarchaeota archaeon SM23-78]